MKKQVLKRMMAMILMTVIVVLLGACAKEQGILGAWKYDVSEDNDPDMKGITVDIQEDIMSFKNTFDDGEEMTMDITYEKDEEIIIVTGMAINGRDIESDEEFIQIPYTLLDEKLMMDLDDVGIGKVIFCRAE